MDPGYDIEPQPIARTRRRPVWLIVTAIAVFVAIGIVKPWALAPGPTSRPATTTGSPAPSPAFAGVDVDPAAAPQLTPDWPAGSAASPLSTASATEAEGALAMLSVRSGTWG